MSLWIHAQAIGAGYVINLLLVFVVFKPALDNLYTLQLGRIWISQGPSQKRRFSIIVRLQSTPHSDATLVGIFNEIRII